MFFSKVLVGISLRKRSIHHVKGDDNHRTHCVPPMSIKDWNHVLCVISTVMKRHYGIPGDGFTWKPNCHAHICVGLDEPLDGQVVQARKRGHEPDAGHGGRMSGHETWHKEEGDGQAASGTHGHHHRQPGKSGSADFPGWRGKYHEYSVASLNMKNLMSPTPRN